MCDSAFTQDAEAGNMSRAISEDLRDRVLDAVAAGSLARGAAERFGIGVATALRWVRRWRDSGGRRTRHHLWNAVAEAIGRFSPGECANYFSHQPPIRLTRLAGMPEAFEIGGVEGREKGPAIAIIGPIGKGRHGPGDRKGMTVGHRVRQRQPVPKGSGGGEIVAPAKFVPDFRF